MGNKFADSAAGCPDVLSGANCTTSWKENLEPASSIILISTMCLLSMEFVVAFLIFTDSTYRTWYKHRELGIRAFKGPGLRIRTLLSCVLALGFYIAYYGISANLLYQKDQWQGKLCITVGALGNGFLFQTVGYVTVLYISTCNNKLSNRTFLETIDVRILKRYAAPWILHLANLIALSLLWTDSLSLHQMDISKLLSGVAITALIPCTYLSFFYYRKLARMLEELSDITLDRKTYLRIAFESRMMSYFHFSIGNIALISCMAVITTDILDNAMGYFILQSAVGYCVAAYFMLFILLYSNGSLFLRKSSHPSTTHQQVVRKQFNDKTSLHPDDENRTTSESVSSVV